jgi:hypothetical protein
VRLTVAGLVLGAVLLGTWRGEDDAFPFGPFKMYASTQSLDGTTSWIVLIGDTLDGRRLELDPAEFGVRRAEIEGRLDLIQSDPDVLTRLVATRRRLQPGGPELVALDVVRRRQPMRAGRPEGPATDEVVARWTGP